MDIIVNDLPVGKCIVSIINCDVEKWKDACYGKVMLSGGVDGSMLLFGEPDQVKKHVTEVLDLWSPGGGYLLDSSLALDQAKPENLRALFETARNYNQKF
jgi:uroporphyrinogen-III decarboxylase